MLAGSPIGRNVSRPGVKTDSKAPGVAGAKGMKKGKLAQKAASSLRR